MSEKEIGKDEMVSYLKIIDQELGKLDQKGEILISGGASMCLVHDARQSTKDIDALYEPKNTINDIAAEIAEHNELGNDWINDGVKGFLHPDMKKDVVLKYDNLTVNTVSAEAILAMKLIALRDHTKDYDDAEFLIRKLDINDPDEIMNVLEKNSYPQNLNMITKYKALDLLDQVNEKREREQKNITKSQQNNKDMER